MNTLPIKFLLPMLLISLMLSSPLLGQSSADNDANRQDAEAALRDSEAARSDAMTSAELARQGAEAARAEAKQAAKMAHLAAERHRSESALRDTGRHQADREARASEKALEREELARAREELSRAHRELREATRDVARAHRDLAGTDPVHEIVHHVNLGDRAVIGVILGKHKERGLEIVGISPDGPAERAGLQQGDIISQISGAELVNNKSARQAFFRVMSEAEDGEELDVEIERDGELLDYIVTVEMREPRGWQSVIRIPEIEVITETAGNSLVISERIEVPDIDEVALAAHVAEITERVNTEFSLQVDGEYFDHQEFEGYSDLGGMALSEAKIWFGLPDADGLELAAINENLGSYFKTDRGVLVINAREDNAYQLESGDVILAVDSTRVNSPADVLRAFRDVEPGHTIELEIKRDRRDKTLSVIIPENRLGSR